ncbi:hypothetical protein [Nonomuraea sp. NPDC049028]|uniref:hypothetical protein n=1 Tax=Nonomuraea sp. NPDC049028 TaxID=3364348 RepID=UPI00371E194E
MPDVYPADLGTRIRTLEREVAELKALLQARQPMTAASKGWLLTDMSIPSVESGTCHLGCNDGDVFSVNASGQVKRMFLQAAVIANQADFTSGDIAGTPTPAQYNALRADAVATRQYAFDLTTILRSAGHIAT